MSSSSDFAGGLAVPVSALQYRDMSGRKLRDSVAHPEPAPVEDSVIQNRSAQALTEEELAARIAQERAEAAQEVELRLRREFEQKLAMAREPIAAMLAGFEDQRSHYYAQVEMEIVQLALSIAAKILHREAQVDPMLVAALVRLAVERMREGSSVTIRVSPGKGASWKQYFAAIPSLQHVE